MTIKPDQRITSQMCLEVLKKYPGKSLASYDIAHELYPTYRPRAVSTALRKLVRDGVVQIVAPEGWQVIGYRIASGGEK